MRYSFLILLMAAIAASASAQTPTTQGASPATAATPAASAAAPSAQTPSTPAATTGTAAKPASGAAAQTKPPAPPPIDFDKLYPDAPVKPADIHCGKSKSCVIKLPPGVPPTDATLVPDFSLYYQDIKIGTGAEAMQDNSYKLHYNAYTAADGVMFDSTYNHRRPVLDKDGKPVKDADGKPKMGDPQPFKFTEGEGRVIPGLDLGILGMKVGGKRRIVIPYQMAYGEQGRRGPNAAHPGVPPKAGSDLRRRSAGGDRRERSAKTASGCHRNQARNAGNARGSGSNSKGASSGNACGSGGYGKPGATASEVTRV